MANHRCFSHFSSDQQYTCDAGLPVIPTYHTWVCHAEQSWSIPTAFLLDETKPKEAARSQRSGRDVLWPLRCCLQNQTETSRKRKVSLNVFRVFYQVLGTKSLTLRPLSCCALHLHRLLYQCILLPSTCCQLGPSERILNLGAAAFFSEPEAGSCIQTSAGNLLTSAYLKWIPCYLK